MAKVICILFLFIPFYGISQDSSVEKSFEFDNIPLKEVLVIVEDTFDVKFSYLDELIKVYSITIDQDDYTLKQILTTIKDITGLEFSEINSRYFAIYKSVENESKSIDEAIDEVLINGYLTSGIIKNNNNSFTIKPHKLSVLPGLTEPDVLQTIQKLPGVISPNETATGLHVRGGTPDQNLILWDGIKMYHNGHLFGMISGFNPNIRQEIQFFNKGTNPKYGDRISSVIAINTDNKINNKAEASLGINALSADVYFKTPLVKDKLNIQVSGRRSFTDIYESYTFDKLSDKVFQNTKVANTDNTNNIFYYQDYNAKINYQFSADNYFSLSSILIDNNMDHLFKDLDAKISYNDKLKIKNSGYSFNWFKQWNPNFSHEISTYYSNYKLNYDFNTSYPDSNFELFTKRNFILDSGFSLAAKYQVNDYFSLDNGYQYTANDVSHAFISENPDLSFVLDTKSAFIQTHSLYSAIHYKPGVFWDLSGGLRVNYYSELNEIVYEPRLQISMNFSNKFKASITGEVRNQTISQIKETVTSDLSLENQLWILSDNDEFPIINAKQATLGLTYKHNKWTIDVDSYYKFTKGLTSLTLGFLNVTDPNIHQGENYANGVEIYVKKDMDQLKAWFTYAYNNTLVEYEEIRDEEYFPFNSEIKHALNLSMSYDIKSFQVALGWNWRTGKPYTSATNLVVDDTVVINYDELNAERLPNYHRLDISSTYSFDISKKRLIKAKFGASIYNVYNQKNLLNREYVDTTIFGDDIQVRDRYSLQFNPNMFLRVYF